MNRERKTELESDREDYAGTIEEGGRIARMGRPGGGSLSYLKMGSSPRTAPRQRPIPRQKQPSSSIGARGGVLGAQGKHRGTKLSSAQPEVTLRPPKTNASSPNRAPSRSPVRRTALFRFGAQLLSIGGPRILGGSTTREPFHNGKKWR